MTGSVPTPDYALLAAQVEGMREILSALVAGLVKDGFTDREARQIIAGSFGTGKPS